MDEDGGFFLGDAHVVVIGLGLMGGSLALALKGHCRRLDAIEPDQATRELARRREVVDSAEGDPAKLLAEADLVILASPVPAILDWLRKLPDYIDKPCIVLDIGSTKSSIVDAMEGLPPNFDPLGGHPICGRERLSLENADADLYRDAPFVLTPLVRTGERARSAAEQIIFIIGSRLLELEAGEHDRILASTSHLPFLLSSALTLATSPDYAAFIGTGFRSVSRLAGTPASMMLGVIGSNRENVLEAIGRFQGELDQLKTAILEEDDAQLNMLLETSRSHYQALISPSS